MEFTKNHSERAQVLQEHVAMQAREWKRKVAALDWLEAHNCDLLSPLEKGGIWGVQDEYGTIGEGLTPLAAIEAAMKGKG